MLSMGRAFSLLRNFFNFLKLLLFFVRSHQNISLLHTMPHIRKLSLFSENPAQFFDVNGEGLGFNFRNITFVKNLKKN